MLVANMILTSRHILTAAARGDMGSQYDLSSTTLSIHIVTAAARGDKPADGIGPKNWAS